VRFTTLRKYAEALGARCDVAFVFPDGRHLLVEVKADEPDAWRAVDTGGPKKTVALSIRRPLVRRLGMEAILNRSPESSTRAATAKIWTARILGALVILFLLVDGAGKVLRLAPYVEGTAKAGYPDASVVPLGLVLLASTILYALPQTAVFGAILLTAYLGGATATHVRLGQPFVFPVVFGVVVWACLYLRDARLRALLPLNRRTEV
jgi:hypothetical protein